MSHAAFSGSYCDLKFIKSRSVAQVVVEIPIEQAAAFIAAFGAPEPSKECPVAIARLDMTKAASEAEKPRRYSRIRTADYTAGAAILCTIGVSAHCQRNDTREWRTGLATDADAADMEC